ncbi:MAG: hypothetical protein IAF38_10850 [Bacteroidia bacterium]|nr:hypothetical protein [Bacteroidia bacterium]
MYSEVPQSLAFTGNTDKNVFAFLRMEVRNKINGRKKVAEKLNFYWEGKMKFSETNASGIFLLSQFA